jgi:hypothetical protein
MFRVALPVAAALLLASAAAQAQYPASPYYVPPMNSSFYQYGVPNGSLHRNLNNGTSIYPWYNFGGYRAVNPAMYPSPAAEAAYNGTPITEGRRLGWRRGWRR